MVESSISLHKIIDLLAMFAGLMYAFQIGTLKKPKTIADKYFTWYFVVLSIILFLFTLTDLKVKGLAKFLIPLVISTALLIGPMIWIYLSALTKPNEKINFKKHFAPATIVILLLIILETALLNAPNEAIKQVIFTTLKIVTIGAITVVFIFQNSFYIYQSLKRLKQHQTRVAEVFSYGEDVDLNWLKIFIYGYLSLIICLVGINFMHGRVSDFSFGIVMIAYIVYTGHNALKQSEIFTKEIVAIEKEEQEEEEAAISEHIKEDNKVNALQKVFEKLKQDLLVLLENEKPYLDQDLTIIKLAKTLNTNSKYLSQVINSEFNQSFIHFINNYRVEEAKKILLDDSKNNLTLEALGQLAGFKSKSSFNIAFKKQTGLTPSEFKKENKKA